MNTIKKVGLALAAIVLVTGMLLALPAGSVRAAGLSEEPPPPSVDQQVRNRQRLERGYVRLQEAFTRQAERLARSDEMVTKAEGRIAEFKEKGLDTSALEAALANYVAKVGEAQGLHDEAGAIIAAHAGFGDDGSVTDPKQAAATLKEAGNKMKQAHQQLEPAVRELLRALREFRRDNRPPRPEPIPQP